MNFLEKYLLEFVTLNIMDSWSVVLVWNMYVFRIDKLLRVYTKRFGFSYAGMIFMNVCVFSITGTLYNFTLDIVCI